ncbi:dimethylamine monooxygenase subunit DmmA family protein [Rhodococcus phenolicus]|uniref:dimethylamine monooxygenase subunit DmmA family protein n=1 Tax=Rhodococcus phenolicus TaxID=263849 RepID=UPI00082A79DA|nr:dimethylamine monooxygenase subunit DmmA family protein [Rhodococcus phenolicus]
MSVCANTTSVPRWAEERAVAPGGRVVTVMSFGHAAAERARTLVASFEGRRVSWLRVPTTWGDAADAALERHLSAARVGWRLVLVGDEASVLAARAKAVAAGALDAEILPEVLVAGRRRLYCVHCLSVHSTDAAIGGTGACPGCDAKLMVYHHVSRRHGAYFGYMIDAEES